MITFEVKDMTCGHCVSAITKAVKAADSGASVDIDLAAHLVRVEPMRSDARSLGAAIEEAGYTPVRVATLESSAPSAPARCQCGAARP